MRVFITGASGHIAPAVIPELIGAGHDVIGLARSDRAAKIVASLGATARRGDLADLDVLFSSIRLPSASHRGRHLHLPRWGTNLGLPQGRALRTRSP